MSMVLGSAIHLIAVSYPSSYIRLFMMSLTPFILAIEGLSSMLRMYVELLPAYQEISNIVKCII